MPEDWRQTLIQHYPALFSRAVGGRKIISGYPTVGEGWQELVETAVGRIAAALAGAPSARITIVQIKEKFGAIRLYYHDQGLSAATAARVEEAVDLAEARSACTCEVCGRPGRMFNKQGWIATRCDRHAAAGAIPTEPEGVLAKYALVDGKWVMVARRKYDRKRDAFVDLPEESKPVQLSRWP
jgi:hypothetical protein